jgi:hypothetical protein
MVLGMAKPVLGSFRLVPGTSKLPGNPMMIPGPSLLSISLTGAADSDTNISLTDYVRLVRTNGNVGPSGDVLRICPHLISRSSLLEVNLKYFTGFESGYQVLDRKRLLFP